MPVKTMKKPGKKLVKKSKRIEMPGKMIDGKWYTFFAKTGSKPKAREMSEYLRNYGNFVRIIPLNNEYIVYVSYGNDDSFWNFQTPEDIMVNIDGIEW